MACNHCCHRLLWLTWLKMNFRRLLTAARHLQRWNEVVQCMRASSEWPKLAACYLGISAFHPFDAVLRDGNRYRLEEYYDLETLWQIYFHQAYKLESGDRVVVDAGANIGLFACFAAAALPECSVYSVEPFPPTYKRLEEHVRANGFVSRIRCFQIALAGVPGQVAMTAEGVASQMVHVIQKGSHTASGKATPVSEATVEVEAVTLGTFLNGLNASQVDLLKIDIEGSEYDVLLAVSPHDLDRVKRINVEYHSKPGHTKQDIVAHLTKCGFHVASDRGSGGYGIMHLRRA